MKRKLIDLQPLHVPIVDSYVKEDDSDFFIHIYGRRLNKLNTRYKLPMDADEKLVNDVGLPAYSVTKSFFWCSALIACII